MLFHACISTFELTELVSSIAEFQPVFTADYLLQMAA
jgi:hypothetical protein